MCDTGIRYFHNLNLSQNEKMSIEDQRVSSLSYLAFWSNPAWFRATKHPSLSTSAIKEWVDYHRLSVAINKETVAQTIGSVKEVIPNSKLAKYGDYSYDIDDEDIYCIFEDFNPKYHISKVKKSAYTRRYDFWASETETDTRDSAEIYPTFDRNNKISLRRQTKSLSEWLKELNRVLISLRQIAYEAQLLDSWTETLLKFCLRFVCILRNNENLVEVLNSDISFIIDYDELRKMSISKTEVQSISQPENLGNIFLDSKSVDSLWMKLSSIHIRNIWKKDMKVPFLFDQQNKPLIPLIKLNFLRSRALKNFHYSRHTMNVSVDIPKNMENKLLGSLVNAINETPLQLGNTVNEMDDKAKNYFPEAHGEWTKHLFPHRFNLNSKFEKKSPTWRQWNAASFPQHPDSNSKIEHGSSEIATMPIQYYKSVPPPSLAARFRSPYMNCQPRNRVIYMPPNSLTSNPSNQQVQFKIPTAPLPNVLPATYLPQTSQNCIVSHQRLGAPTYTGIIEQYQKLNFLRAPHQHNTSQDAKTEPQKCPPMADENSCLENISIKNGEEDSNEGELVSNDAETRFLDIPLPPSAPYVQLNRGYNIPFRIQQNIGNINKPSQRVISNPSIQIYERMPVKMNYPIPSVRLRAPLMKNEPSLRNQYIFPQLNSKPRFLGPITINNLKRIQERLFQQRYECNYIKEPPNQVIQKCASFENISSKLHNTSIDCDDKVEKWLESVDKYVKSDSFINLEELSEHQSVELTDLSSNELPEDPRIQLPDIYKKLHGSKKGDCEELEKWQNENLSEFSESNLSGNQVGSSFSAYSDNSIKSRENKTNILKKKKIKAKKEFYEHLQLLQDIVPELKKCKNLRIKMKILKGYFTEINSISAKRFHFDNFIKILEKKSRFIKKVGQSRKNRETSSSQKNCLEIKFDKQIHTESNIDMRQSNLLMNDSSKYKMWIRESQEFNVFPSKRMKMSKSQPSFFETETLIRDKQRQWISNLNYLDSTVDELFFDTNGIEKSFDGNWKKLMNTEVNGWTHFKIAVKTVIENVISSLNAKISQNS